MARYVTPRLTIAQAEAILEMLCGASGIDDKEHDLAVYERAADAMGDALSEARIPRRQPRPAS